MGDPFIIDFLTLLSLFLTLVLMGRKQNKYSNAMQFNEKVSSMFEVVRVLNMEHCQTLCMEFEQLRGENFAIF